MTENQRGELRLPFSAPRPPAETKVPKRWKFVDLKGFFFAAFLYVGLFKGDELFDWLPVDMTLILAFIITVFMLYSLFHNKFQIPKALLPVLGIQLLFFLPVLWTEWTDYALRKVTFMFTLTFLSMIFPIMIFRTREDLRRFLNALAMITLVICVEGVIRFLEEPSMFTLIAYSADYISLGRICGVTLIWFVCLFVQSDSWFWRAVLLLMISLTTSVLIGAGARGPVLSLIISLTVLTVLFYLYDWRDILNLFLISGFLVLVISASLALAPRGSKWRVSRFLTGKADIIATGRPEMFRTTLKGIVETPLGLGWGGYEKFSTGYESRSGKNFLKAVRYYPHNLLLEAFLEGGWLIGIALAILLVSSIYFLGRLCFRIQHKELRALFGILVYLLIASMISGGWNDNRDLFAFVALSILYVRLYNADLLHHHKEKDKHVRTIYAEGLR